MWGFSAPARDAAHRAAAQCGAHRQVEDRPHVLRQVGDEILAARRRHGLHRVPFAPTDAAELRAQESREQIEDGGFAAAALAHEGDDVPVAGVESDVGDSETALAEVGVGQSADPQGRSGKEASGGRSRSAGGTALGIGSGCAGGARGSGRRPWRRFRQMPLAQRDGQRQRRTRAAARHQEEPLNVRDELARMVGIGGPQRTQGVLGRAVGEEPAVVQGRDVRGDVAAALEMVLRHDDGQAEIAVETAQQVQRGAAADRVEAGGRFVEQQQARSC